MEWVYPSWQGRVLSNPLKKPPNWAKMSGFLSISHWLVCMYFLTVPASYALYTVYASFNSACTLFTCIACMLAPLRPMARSFMCLPSLLQEKREAYIEERLTTVREVETITGISFFPNLPITDQNTLALRIVPSLQEL